jgi:twitching motility two-component system response regulator PilH
MFQGNHVMSIKTILIVDDSPTERYLLAEMLASGGYTLIQADSGEAALERARADRPDLILMDVVMPGMNGFHATRSLVKDEATHDIPIIMCTSKNLETDRIWGMRQGAVDYIMKPVQREELLAKIAALDAR